VTVAARREDPRVARSKAAVLEATVDLLAEVGWAGCSVEGVAERSGVAKTTIYRHWPCRGDLLFAAFDALIGPPEPADTGALRDDLTAQLRLFASGLDQGRWARVLPALVEAAERDPHLRELARDFARHRRDALRQILRRGAERGELDGGTDVDLAATMLGAPFFYRRFISREPVDDAFIEALVDGVLRAVGAGAGPTERPLAGG
jgi:AcrR family transcriptional regulator